MKDLFTCNVRLTIYANIKLVNWLLLITKIKKSLRHIQKIWIMINPQQWQYWKMMKIIPFILVNSFSLSLTNYITLYLHVLTVLMTYSMNLIGFFFSKNYFICTCYTLDELILNSFVGEAKALLS